MGRQAIDQPPEGGAMVVMGEMRDLVGDDIVGDIARRHRQAPGETQPTAPRARPPARSGVGHAQRRYAQTEFRGLLGGERGEGPPRLGAQEVAHAPRQEFGPSPDTQDIRIAPRRATQGGFVAHDDLLAEQRHAGAVGEGRRWRQPRQMAADPTGLAAGEPDRAGQSRARRQDEDDAAGACIGAQRDAARARIAADQHTHRRAAVFDRQLRGIIGRVHRGGIARRMGRSQRLPRPTEGS
jgi:hypothetical protein